MILADRIVQRTEREKGLLYKEVFPWTSDTQIHRNRQGR